MTNNLSVSPFDKNILFYFNKISKIKGQISEVEYRIICNSVLKRKNEFTAGRILSHKALVQLNIYNFDILTGKNREPIWPKGIIGSISHNNSFVCAAVTTSDYYKGIGIDVEEDEAIQVSQHNIIFTKNELLWIEREQNSAQENIHKIIFSAKESLYKCIYPIVKKYIDFKQVEMEIDFENQTLRIIKMDDVDQINTNNVKLGYKQIDKQIFTYALYN